MNSKAAFLFLFSIVTLLILNSCEEDLVEKSITQPDPITPDLTVKINASVSGFVTDETGTPIVYADVIAGDKRALTDEYGYFRISNSSLAGIAGQVKVTRNGYFEGYKTFLPVENEETFVRLKLLSKTESGTIDAATGGTVTLATGGMITLPSNGAVTASNGSDYTGQIHISARLISSTEDDDLQQERPGDLRGTDSDGHLKALRSFSTIAVELTGDNGQLLQLAEGKPATISLPVPSSLVADAPSSIDLWSFDKNTGLWKQEGTASKSGDAYVGSVTHFSFWDGAEGLPLVTFSARIVDATSQPLANVPVSITFAGMPGNAGHGRFGYTDENGFVTGSVFANKDLVLDILTPCALSAYSHEFSSTSTDIDLGTLTGNLGQSVVTLHGTATNCDGQPVTNGYIQTYDNGFYNRITIDNGNFTFTGLACTNTDINVVVVDNTTYQQNAPQTISIDPGENDLGALTACGTNTMGSITYTIDDITTTISEPADTIAGYSLTPAAWTQILVLSGDPNGNQQMSFQFDGGTSVSSAHGVTDVFSLAFPSGRGYWPAPVTVTITEYGKVGGFIAGSFSSNMLDFEDNSLHMLTCSFRVRRRV